MRNLDEIREVAEEGFNYSATTLVTDLLSRVTKASWSVVVMLCDEIEWLHQRIDELEDQYQSGD